MMSANTVIGLIFIPVWVASVLFAWLLGPWRYVKWGALWCGLFLFGFWVWCVLFNTGMR